MELNTLFKQNNTGTLQQWRVWVEGNVVNTEFGQVGGKLQATQDVIKTGKNIGKVNETTPEQQARLKAEQLFEKKVKEGYVPDVELAKSTKNTLGAVEPMLAFPIEDKLKYVKYPAYVQPKLDGMRCIAMVQDGKCKLFSRTQKEINTVPHIVAEIETKFAGQTIILDGELYNHEHKENFNRIMSLIKRDEVHPEATEIQYHVYDVVSEENYAVRTALIQHLIDDSGYLKLVPTMIVKQQSEMDEVFDAFLEAGYEGAMYRNPLMSYENKRSVSLLKVKIMKDAEFEIIGVQEGNGKLQGKAGAFIVKTAEGKEFKAKLKGELEALTEYFVNFDKYKGKQLTVQYQGLTPDGIPRFPVGLRVRVDE